jgi:polar amino acid transport system permease protein
VTDSALSTSIPAARPRVKRDVVPVRHYGRGILAVVVAFAVITGIQGLATNPNIEWSVVADYLFDSNVLRGLQRTLLMTVIGTALSIVLAVIIAVMRLSKSRIISGVAAAYVFIFRGVPLIVLLIFVGNLGLFFKVFSIGVPFTDIVIWSRPARDVMTPFIASVVGLTLAGSGYMSEIVRGGLLAVGRGQHEAAKSVGLGSLRTIWYIILPQAMRVIVPPLGNEIIGMLKASAIVSVIAGGDLLTVVTGISGTNFRTIEMLMVATIWYLLVITALSVGQWFLERRVAER